MLCSAGTMPACVPTAMQPLSTLLQHTDECRQQSRRTHVSLPRAAGGRAMVDAVLLPNGQVVLVNGAEVGLTRFDRV